MKNVFLKHVCVLEVLHINMIHHINKHQKGLHLQKMTIANYFQLLLLTTFVLEIVPQSLGLPQEPERKTTCGIRHWEARDMMLTCFFHEDINVSHKGFTVYLYTGHTSPTTVTSCDWFSEFTCNVNPAYEYDQVIYRDHTNIRIPDATEKHVGTYRCQVTGEKNPGSCSFTASQIPPKPPAPSPYLGQMIKTVSPFEPERKTTCGIRHWEARDMMLTCYFHEDINVSRKDFTVYLYTGHTSPTPVTSCGWFPELSCDVNPAYKYDQVIYRDHINIRIPDAAEKHVGTYRCQVTGEKNPGSCSFTASQLPPHLPAPTTYLEQTTKTLPHLASTTAATSVVPDDRQTQRMDEQSSASAGFSAAESQGTAGTRTRNIVIPVVVVGVVLIVVVVSVTIYWRHRSLTAANNPEMEEEDSSATEPLSTTGNLKRRAVQPEERMELKQN